MTTDEPDAFDAEVARHLQAIEELGADVTGFDRTDVRAEYFDSIEDDWMRTKVIHAFWAVDHDRNRARRLAMMSPSRVREIHVRARAESTVTDLDAEDFDDWLLLSSDEEES